VSAGSRRHVIIEIRRIGDLQRVAAVDGASGVEVVIQAPASASRAEVESLVIRKLEMVLAREQAPASDPPPRRGKQV
jgi:Domain of unknown function (DUF6898)